MSPPLEEFKLTGLDGCMEAEPCLCRSISGNIRYLRRRIDWSRRCLRLPFLRSDNRQLEILVIAKQKIVYALSLRIGVCLAILPLYRWDEKWSKMVAI
jgi:hypothetical protein